MVGRGVALELHFHQDAIAQSNQTAGVKVAVDLWILGPPVINNMLVNEVGFVAIEAVSNENGNVILPSVTRGCGEEYPLVGLGDFQKCFCPGAIPDNPLFVKYKECVFDVLILADVVP